MHLFGCIILRPNRLPRGFSSLILAVVYHTHWTKDENDSMRGQLFQSISLAESRHANCALIVAGDLNRLDIKSLKKQFRLKQIVKTPTRKNAILDLVLTSLHIYYDEPLSFPPFGLSDNNTVTAKARVTESGQNSKKLKQTWGDIWVLRIGPRCFPLLTAVKICYRCSTKHCAQNSICSCPLRGCVWTHLIMTPVDDPAPEIANT